jgi:hypothetical protein
MTTITVSFQPDSEGFTSRACMACGTRFKAAFGQGAAAPLAFCPYCRHEGSRWETPEQFEYAKAYVMHKELGPAVDKVTRAFKNLGRAGGSLFKVTVSGSGPKFPRPHKPIEHASELPTRTTFTCCGETIRHDAALPPRFCVICGVSSAEVTT